MNPTQCNSKKPLYAALATVLLGAASPGVSALEPCGDLGECKVLIEINSSDGDVGFHFLMDGDDFNSAKMKDPNGIKLFQYHAKDALMDQKLTETFAESAEPLCFDPAGDDDDENDDEDFVTLEEFLERWTEGTYKFVGIGDDDEKSVGKTDLTFHLPAAPADVDFSGGVVSWSAGDDLGECADSGDLDVLVMDGVLPEHPEDVEVASWEVVLEPDVEDGDLVGSFVFSIRLDGGISPMMVTVPADYLDSLPDDTPVKVEVGAIGIGDNATFSEEDGFCVNEVDGCEEED